MKWSLELMGASSLWRAVDQDSEVLDILVQSRRDKKAAKSFIRKFLKGSRYVPRVMITDKLKSYSAARTEAMPSVEHCGERLRTTARRIHINRPKCGCGS